MTTILLNAYLQKSEFETIVHQIYDEICSNDLVKHYLVLAKKNAILHDLRRYWPYLTPKPAIDYRRPAPPTASIDIRLPESQFAEISQIMARVFREWKVNPEHVPQLTHEILELIEESRSQTNDTLASKLEAKEVSADKLQYFLKRYKIATEVMPSKAIMVERGLPYKVWLRIDLEVQLLHIEGRIAITDAAFDDDIEAIMEQQAGLQSMVKLQLETAESGRRLLLARHQLSCANGIPMRLLVRYLQRFSMGLDQVMTLDKDGILRSA